jgi:large subunit ribosomal protein L3
MIHTLIGSKIKQSQVFDQRGYRKPITVLEAGPCWITQIKTVDIDGYDAIQLGFGHKRENRVTKPLQGHIKKAGLEKKAPRFFREVSIKPDSIENDEMKIGDTITVDQIFHPGDRVNVTGVSKGKGFAGVMKRWNFKGGPATHGQSDRERAPGSIGGTTTPGRVYKGKKMAGRMGSDKITVKNLQVVSIDAEKNELIVTGVIPGPKKGLIMIEVTKKTDNPVKDSKAEEISADEKDNSENNVIKEDTKE